MSIVRQSVLIVVVLMTIMTHTYGFASILFTSASGNNSSSHSGMEWVEERKLMLDLRPSVTDRDVNKHVFTFHRIERGETLWSLGVRYGVSVGTLTQVNDLLDPDVLRAGRILLIPPGDGILYVVGNDETLLTVAKKFNIPSDELLLVNLELESSAVTGTGGDRLFVPGVSPQQLITDGGDGQAFSARFVWPVRGRVTSGYGPRWGRFHSGIDIAAPTGTTVRSTESGKVVSVGWISGYGRTIRIEHATGVKSLYGHLSTAYVRTGQQVHRGEVIGLVGTTGYSTGPHLHFEIIKNGKPVDPIPLLTERK